MGKVKYTDFEKIGGILESVALDFEKEKTSPKTIFFSMWQRVIDKKMFELTKPVSVNARGILTVACKNAAVSSELIMRKKDILDNIKTISDTLGIEVSDIIFNHKIWNNIKD